MDGSYVTAAYAEHLTDSDLEMLAEVSGMRAGAAAALRGEPAALLDRSATPSARSTSRDWSGTRTW